MLTMKSEIRSGVAIGVAGFLWLLLEFFLGFHTTRIDYQPFITWLSIVIPIVGIYWAMKAKRDRYYAGRISFIQALKTGLIITVVMSIVSPLLSFMYVSVINPLYLSTMLAHNRMMLDGLNISPADKDGMLQELIQQFSLSAYLLKSILIAAISGTLLSIITAAVMNRNTSEKQQTADHSVTDYIKK